MRNLHLQYVDETYDQQNRLLTYKINYPETFNFAYDVADDIAIHDPDRQAMMWCNTKGEEHRFTFADMKRYSDKTANMFKAAGIQKGDHVLVILKRHYQFWFTILALHKLGAVIIPATHLLTKHDLVYRINAAPVQAVVCTRDGDVAEAVEAAEPECPSLRTKFLVNGQKEGWIDFNHTMEAASETLERVPTNVNEPLLLYFTSGTTGNPKMVRHNHTYPLGHLSTAKHWQNVDPEGLHFTISDTGWGKAVWGKIYGQWLMEAGIFTYDFDKFVPHEILSLFHKYHITSLCCPPTMFRFFIKEDLSQYDLSTLKYCTIAGEALNPEVFNRWHEATGLKLMEGFGQTETTCIIANLRGMEPKPGSMGKPNPQYEVDIVDEEGKSVDPGVTGEIVIRTDKSIPVGLFQGYYKDDTLTQRSWHDGLYHTGDTAWKDEDGYYWYVGRTDDIIKSSGYRIGPFEIESVLMEHPAVLECAVTGVPDPVRGNIIKATVVLTKQYSPSEALKVELQEHVKKLTAPYKYPRVIEFTSELPKTISGKIRRVELRKGDHKS